jgi:hypothetical protein
LPLLLGSNRNSEQTSRFATQKLVEAVLTDHFE